MRSLVRLGMIVYLGSRDEAAGEQAADSLKAEGEVHPVRLDITDRTTMEPVVQRIGESHGKLHVLVNNAGVAGGGMDALTADLEVVKRIFETNVWGAMTPTQLAAPWLRAAGSARVVNVSSNAGSFAYLQSDRPPAMKPLAYCLSKLALNGATVLFSEAKKDGVKVNAANPGLVKTALSHFMGTRGPEEGAKVVIQLATLPDDGPTGGFFDEKGPIPW